MIYIACPAGVRTGGTELLHQLAFELSKHTKACLYYIGDGLIKEYERYQIEYVEKLPDNDDYVVVPEIWAHMNIGDHKRIIYWESVDNFFLRYSSLVFDEDVIHLAQSYYSLDIINGVINAKRCIELTDYINDDFLTEYEEHQRKDVVLYNPAKGLEYTEAIMKECEDIHFTPVIGLTREQCIETFRDSKLYIDFGDHPGKDRMPREAAICGCCVITGRDGSANYKDVPIPEKYKIDRENVKEIAERIKDTLENYDTCVHDFKGYRKTIKGEKRKFRRGVKELVHEIQRDHTSA